MSARKVDEGAGRSRACAVAATTSPLPRFPTARTCSSRCLCGEVKAPETMARARASRERCSEQEAANERESARVLRRFAKRHKPCFLSLPLSPPLQCISGARAPQRDGALKRCDGVPRLMYLLRRPRVGEDPRGPRRHTLYGEECSHLFFGVACDRGQASRRASSRPVDLLKSKLRRGVDAAVLLTDISCPFDQELPNFRDNKPLSRCERPRSVRSADARLVRGTVLLPRALSRHRRWTLTARTGQATSSVELSASSSPASRGTSTTASPRRRPSLASRRPTASGPCTLTRTSSSTVRQVSLL